MEELQSRWLWKSTVSCCSHILSARVASLSCNQYNHCHHVCLQAPTTVGPNMRVDSMNAAWLQPDNARILDECQDAPFEGATNIAEAVAMCISIAYLFHLKFPVNLNGTWRFLAEEVCKLPSSVLTRHDKQLIFINLLGN